MPLLDRVIGHNLRICRRRKGLRRPALAAALNVSVDDIRDFEAGRKRIGPRRLWRLSEIIGYPLACFFGHAPGPDHDVHGDHAGEDIAPHVKAQALALARAYYMIGDFRSRATVS